MWTFQNLEYNLKEMYSNTQITPVEKNCYDRRSNEISTTCINIQGGNSTSDHVRPRRVINIICLWQNVVFISYAMQFVFQSFARSP